MYDVVQMKLTNGSEVVCEVLEWPDSSDNQMIVRNALSIVNVEIEGGERIYMFVPWIHFNESSKDYLLVNTDHIIATAKPNGYLFDQYKVAVFETNNAHKEREEEHEKRKRDGLKKLEKAIDRVITSENKRETSTNVIVFPGNDDDKIH